MNLWLVKLLGGNWYHL